MSADAANTAQFFINGQKCAAPALAPGLYIVATPIGNLGDITLRALQTLAAANAVLCEDTRQSAKLLNHYGIKSRLVPVHDHNERDKIPQILQRLAAGEAIALISDAGTPLISDPGFPLVRAVRAADGQVFAVPGASAVLSGLAVAGLPTDSFAFLGFLPPKNAARLKSLAPLKDRPETMVFYESPRRLGPCLANMAEVFGPEREAAVALELTKRYERVKTGTLAELAAFYDADDTKGEAVILVGGAGAMQPVDENLWQEALAEALKAMPLRGAVDEITTTYALKRKQVYDAALAIKNQS
jgi:16S rRNA (cytidine1402-2'-O)-methyltransferase